MRLCFNYNQGDSEMQHQLRRRPEHCMGKTTLEISEDIEQKEVNLIEVKAGIFHSKFEAKVSNGEIQVRSKITLGKAMYTVILALLSLFAIVVVLAEISLWLEPERNNDVHDLMFLGIVLAPAIVMWVVYIIYYKIRPKKILLNYFTEVIHKGKHTNVQLEKKREAYWEEQLLRSYPELYTEEEISAETQELHVKEEIPPIMQKFKKKQIIWRIVELAIIFLFLAAIFVVEINTVNMGMVCGTACLAWGIWLLVGRLMEEKNERRIAVNARPYEATVIDFIVMDRHDSNYVKIYEFKDEFGNLHIVESVRQKYLRKNQNAEDMIGAKVTIWYAPKYSIQVLEGAERPVIKPFYKEWHGIWSVACIAFACVLYVIAGTNYEPKDAVGKSLEIEWAKECEEDNLTQADIESDTVQWICNTYAIRAEFDGGELHTIGIFEPTEENAEEVQEYLEEVWGITNRKTAIDTINRVLEHGTRQKYKKFVKTMEEDGWFELEKEEAEEQILYETLEEKEYRYEGAYKAYMKFGEKGIDAWDYCRMIRIAGECYVAGYFNLEECMNQCLPIAQQLQEEFDSWEEMNQSYLYGYMYWSKTKEDGHSKAVNMWELEEWRLQTMENGPYELEYDIELTDTWSSVKK